MFTYKYNIISTILIVSFTANFLWADRTKEDITIDLIHQGSLDILNVSKPKKLNFSLTEEEAINKIMFAEEIKRWKSAVGHKGNGVIIRLEQSPSDSSPLWCFRLLENLHTHTATFGVYCIDAQMHYVSRMDLATEKLEPINIVIPLSTKKILSIIPEKMFGWMVWQDNRGNPIDMVIHWTKRSTDGNNALFSGKVTYIQSGDQNSEAYMQMTINTVTRKVVITESESKKQKNFDTQGKFYGELQADLLTIVGQWKKDGYNRVADFSIFDKYSDE